MRVSVIGAETDLGRLVSDRLDAAHEVRRYRSGPESAREPREDSQDVRSLDLLDESAATVLCEEVDAVVHLGALALADASAADGDAGGTAVVDRLDAIARGTYNLFAAAREAGVDRVVLASSLALFDPYDPDYLIDEWWKPLPGTDPRTLSIYAAEEVARQYCLQGGIRCVALRVLPLGGDSERETHPVDAVSAVERALELTLEEPGYLWRVFHIARAARFVTRNAREILGWEAHHA